MNLTLSRLIKSVGVVGFVLALSACGNNANTTGEGKMVSLLVLPYPLPVLLL